MQIFDGAGFARGREELLRALIGQLSIRPRIVSVVFEEDAGSQLYTRLKCEAASRVGIEFDRVDVSMLQPMDFLQDQVREACERIDVHGVLVQKPSKTSWQSHVHEHPARMEDFSALWKGVLLGLDHQKDVDCLSEERLAHVYAGTWEIVPATAKAILSILRQAVNSGYVDDPLNTKALVSDLGVTGMNAVVIGRSRIVGKPVAALLEQAGARVTVCGSATVDMNQLTKQADILISATGRPGLVTGEMVKEGSIVIDVGSPEGDVDFDTVQQRAQFITPVPFGVGPVTVVSLLENLVFLVAQ